MSNCFNQLVDLLCEINEQKPTSLGSWAAKKVGSGLLKGLGNAAELGVRAAGFAAGVPVPALGINKKVAGAVSAGKGLMSDIKQSRRSLGKDPCISPSVTTYINRVILDSKLPGINDAAKTSRDKILNALKFYVSSMVNLYYQPSVGGRPPRRHNLNTFTVRDFYRAGSPDTKRLIMGLKTEEFITSSSMTVGDLLTLISTLYTSFEGDDITAIRASSASS